MITSKLLEDFKRVLEVNGEAQTADEADYLSLYLIQSLSNFRLAQATRDLRRVQNERKNAHIKNVA